MLQKAELAARVLAAGIVGVLLGELGQVAAGAELLENVFGLGLGGCVGLGVCALGHLDEDVADLHLIGNLVVLEVRLVVLLGLLIGDLGRPPGSWSGVKAM